MLMLMKLDMITVITYKSPASSKFKRPLIYLSGGFTVPLEKEKSWLKRAQCTHRCYSYAYVREGALYYDKRVEGCLNIDIAQGVGIMMDSSAFTFHGLAKTGRDRGMTDKDIEKLRGKVMGDYAKFIKENAGKFDFFCTFDWIKHSPTIYKVTKKLEKEGIRCQPVFHGDVPVEWLERYFDEGHDFISLGSDRNLRPVREQKKKFLCEVFDFCAKFKNIRIHGLAVTGYHKMMSFPFYSVDSASWAKISGLGQILIINPVNGQIQYVHISNQLCVSNKNQYVRMEKSVQRSVQDWVEKCGFDLDKIRNEPYERGLFNAWVYCHIHSLVAKAEPYTRWEAII